MNCYYCKSSDYGQKEVVAYCQDNHKRMNFCLAHIQKHFNEYDHLPKIYKGADLKRLKICVKIKENVSHILKESNKVIQEIQHISKIAVKNLIQINKNLDDIKFFREKVIYSGEISNATKKIKEVFSVPNYKALYNSEDLNYNPVRVLVDNEDGINDVKRTFGIYFELIELRKIETITQTNDRKYYYICN